MVGGGVALIAAFCVLYPVYFLLQAAFDVGEPDARPPTAYGFDNFIRLRRLLADPAQHAGGLASPPRVMALVFGFLTAWILNRTDVPFRRTLEQAMAVPYYVTPLLGALAWSLLGAPESGFINQVWRALGGDGALIDITGPIGIAWVMALFEGSVAFVMIGAVMKSMDPSLEEASQVIGGGRLRTMLRVTLPLVAPGRARRGDLRVRRDARFVLGRARARPAEPLLRHHDGDLPAGLAISAAHPARGGDGRVAVRRDVPDAVRLSAHHRAAAAT